MLKLRRKRVCHFCQEKVVYIDFKDERKLFRYLTEQGKIIPRHTSGTCAKHQRQLARAIKRARHLALIPFVTDFTR
ncbi:MAG TPA: 30S ribosomal protein S18 [Caldithrix abyssi]|uniref:Small ribosomal subunit protein bS18 n=1 Tax=Caldithrix abyssi TaxID=187145 RepID=A0A7V5PPH1_CALAY|nr:30S ribosomal protein S18 [Caldithrix abyssi]